MQHSDDKLLRTIAIFKLLKALLLVFAGMGALALSRGDSALALQHHVEAAGLEPGHRILERAVTRLATTTPTSYHKLGIGSFVYAALFLTEGAGLWLRKPWAEWFTAIITGSLIPIEIYEMLRHPTIAKAFLILVNVVIVGYLLYRIRKRRSA